jgi:hypothetical protein
MPLPMKKLGCGAWQNTAYNQASTGRSGGLRPAICSTPLTCDTLQNLDEHCVALQSILVLPEGSPACLAPQILPRILLLSDA